MFRLIATGLVGALALAATTASVLAQAKTIDTIKQKGMLSCGVSPGVPGFSNPDDKGNWKGFDVDFCRAVSAVLFNDPDKVSYKPLTAKERFTALQSGEVDILSRTTTWTVSRDSAMGLVFGGIMYYDGQGFIVKKALNMKAAKELSGASICVQTGTTTELNLSDFFRTNNIQYKPVVFEKADEAVAAYDSGRCDAYTTDASSLYAQRLKMKNPDDNVVLPDIISKEPLGPVVRQGDFQWFTLVKWVYYALINAEELGVDQKNVAEMTKSTNPEIRRLLGVEGDFGKGLGVDNDWVVRIVGKVGNYGEIYHRHLGDGSPLKIARGVNNLWNKGGLQYAPPVR
jgi:general L-amino acid transport system substrate-binding protein